jgi:F0F1-type ATP synthase assembly protein I
MQNKTQYRIDLAAVRGFLGTLIGAALGPIIDALSGDVNPVTLKKSIVIGLLIGLGAALGVDTHAYRTAVKEKGDGSE